ncbi:MULTISPECIES: hypothetical protein [unclassified Paenibacillus]|uniref:hypothetical protein n=1 Tax=unclassified Paenibacillus TaxID=185978 RepID=UPI001160E0D0|nr:MULTISPECIES: hypothetical protein [unclassified Paenibacillus]
MSSTQAQGCPNPLGKTLRQRLTPLIGSSMSVYTPGSAKPSRTRGRLHAVDDDGFTVAALQVLWEAPFYIVVPIVAQYRMPYEVVARGKNLGCLAGKLIAAGLDYVEFIQIPGSNVPTIYPLNAYTDVVCSHQGDE